MTNRKNTFLIKRSNVPGKVPAPGDLQLGELALNTADVILYASGTTANQILPIGWDRLSTLSGGTVNGDVTINGFVSATTYYNLPAFSGEYLPLSGGTVYGNTIFTSGLTASTLTVEGLTQTSGITSTGGIIFPQKTINSTYTAQTEDYSIDASGGTFTIYLPTAVGVQGKLYNIKNNGGGAVTVQPFGSETIDDKPFVILGETNALQLVSNGTNWVALGYNISTVNSSTGVFEFTGLTKISATTFSVSSVKGWVVDDTTNPLSPQIYYIDYSGGTYTDNYVNTDFETFVYLTSSGIIGQQPTPLTEQQRRQNIFLGKLGHPDKTAINLVFSQPDFVLSPLAQLRDMFVPINLINGGVVPSTNGTNLKFNTNAGYIYGLGINFANDTLAPNALYIPGTNPCTFQYRTQTGGTVTNVTDIDPLNYDVGGVVTPVTGTKATNQRIYLLQNGSIRVMYGQEVYNTLALAIEALQTESFTPFPNFVNNAVLIGILTVLSTATDLTDTSKARFFFASKFGETVGAAGGTSTTNLQQAYNNSSTPEITTNAIQDGVQIRGGTGNDNDKNIIIESNSGTQTAWITASGDSRFHSVSSNTISDVTRLTFNNSHTGTTAPAQLTWNTSEGTLNLGMLGGNVTQQIGLEQYYQVINNVVSSGITNGSVVAAYGVDNITGKINGGYMIANGTLPYYVTLGVATEDILSGNTGYVNNFGIVRDIDTTGTPYGETWLQGDILYVSPTILGGLTNVIPDTPNLKIQIALVLKVGTTDGTLFVRPSLGYDLNDLHNVKNSGSESNGDLLIYSASTSSWVYGKTLNGNYQINGNLTIPTGILSATTINSNTINVLDLNVTNDLNVTGDTNLTNTFISSLSASTITTNSLSATTNLWANYIDLNSSYTGSTEPARLSWNPTEGTLNIGMKGGNVTQQVGLEQYYRVFNFTGATITGATIENGRTVRVSGVLGGSDPRLIGAYALANGDYQAKFFLGISTENISTGQTGYVTSFGLVRDLDTTGTLYGESWSAGTVLYVSPIIPGGLTSVEPQSPNQRIEVAAVVKVDSTTGVLFVRPNISNSLNDLLDVFISSGVTNGDLLMYNSLTNDWINSSTLIGSAYTINGNLTVTGTTDLIDLYVDNLYTSNLSGFSSSLEVTNLTGTTFTSTDSTIINLNTTNITGDTFNITTQTQDNTLNEFLVVDTNGDFYTRNYNSINYFTGLTINELSANTISGVTYIDFDITQTGTTSSPGRLFWDVNNRTLSLGMIGGTTQQIGEEQYFLVENQTSGTLNDGTVVRAAGVNGPDGKIAIDYMIANGTIPAYFTMGVLTQTLLSGETGYVTSFGLVRGIDTTGAPYGETWNDGDVLYVSPSYLGGFTKVRPIVPNQDILVAIVMTAAVNGAVFVRPDVYRPFKDPQLITVAKQNADFTSIKAAVDSITGSSSSKRYVVTVGPGEFTEGEIDLTSKPYVSIVGSNIQTTLIKPLTNTQHIIKIGINNEISFLSLSGASSSYAGIYAYDIGDFGQAHKVSFYNCDTNVWVESDTQDTKFYGEYLDFNGEFTYGTKVIGNNGYLALANMENYYNFPTGSNVTYCNYATGSGATLSVFVGDNVSNGVSGSTGFYIQDGAELNASTITCDGFTYGILNPNIGDPIRFDIDNASIVNGEWDLYVERAGTFGTFGGSSSHQKIYTISPDVYWSFLDIDDGELEITRKASVTFSDGTHTDFTTLLFEGATMGLIDGGHISEVSGLTINVDAGFGYLYKSATPDVHVRVDWLSANTVLTSGSSLYIYYNENSVLSTSGSKPSSTTNIILGRVVTDETSIRFIDSSPIFAQHTSNKFDSLFSDAMGPIYTTGSIVTEGTTPFTINVTQGDYHYSTNKYLPVGGSGLTFTQYYRDGLGDWITTATTIVNSTSYDGNGVLSALTTSYYTKHTLYLVGDNANEQYMLVLGQNEYSTLVQAENALLATPPSFFSDSVVQIANIYIQQGTTGFTEVEDIRPTIAFRAGGVNASSVHGNLLGLGADDHIQYLLVNGGRAMSGNLDMGSNDITNVGLVDGVTVSAHATRHQFGGADPVGSVTPSANAIPYADVNGLLDSWISTASTTTLGKVKLSTAPTSASNPIVVSTTDPGYTKSITGLTYSSNVLTGTSVDGSVTTTTIGLRTKAGTVAGASFSGNPKKFTVTFTTAYPNTNYSIQITGGVNRTFTYESKSTTGFVINSNANTAFVENVDWVTIATGES